MLKIWGLLSLGLSMALLAPRPAVIKSQSEGIHFALIQTLGRGTAQTIAWSPTDELLAVGGSRGITIYGGNLQVTNTLTSPWGGINEIIWSPDGHLLASASEDMSLRIWDAHNGQMRHELGNHNSPITAIAWHPQDPDQLASTAYNVITIWNVSSGQLVANFTHPTASGLFSALAWHPDGTSLAATGFGNQIVLWDTVKITSHPPIETITSHLSQLAWSPSGRYLASNEASTLYLWDSATGQVATTLRLTDALINTLTWQHEQSLIISTAHRQLYFVDSSTGTISASWSVPQPINAIAYHAPTGKLATANSNGTISIWQK